MKIKKVFFEKTDSMMLQLFRYVFVGGLAALFDIGVLFLLERFLDVPYLIAASCGFIVGVTVNYFLAKLLVFQSKTDSRTTEFILFLLVGVIGLLLTVIIMFIGTDLGGLDPLFSKIIAILLVFFWNFGARRFLFYNVSSGVARVFREHRVIFLLTFLCASLLFLYFAVTQNAESVLHGDSRSYYYPAQNMVTKGMFSYDGITPYTFRTPGYPSLIAIFFALGGNLMGVVMFQIFLTAAVALCIYALVLKVASSKWAATLASVFFMCDIAHYTYDLKILSETLFYTLLVVSALLFYCWLLRMESIKYWVLFTLAINLALLTRPILQYFNLLIVLALLVATLLKKVKWRQLVIFASIFILCFGGWSLRNYIQTGEAVYSTVRGFNLLQYDGAYTYAEVENVPFREAQAAMMEMFDEAYPDNESLSDPVRFRLMGEVGGKYISSHLKQYLVVNAKGLVSMLIGPGRDNFTRENIPTGVSYLLMAFMVSLTALAYLLYLLGLLLHVRKLKIFDICLFLLVGYLIAASASVGSIRFRTSFMPLVMIGAVISWRFDDWAKAKRISRKVLKTSHKPGRSSRQADDEQNTGEVEDLEVSAISLPPVIGG